MSQTQVHTFQSRAADCQLSLPDSRIAAVFYGEAEMSSLMERHGLDQLPPEEHIQLARELWESLSEQDISLTFSEADLVEFKRRLEEHERNPALSSASEEVLERVRKAVA